ncbi:PLP-dependent aminotransferase family protein [Parathalassolituus penaei]|uniref:PLP-dependent aminotransferase family protein n=1 Tax=Parathalassolituus penaei TaxID=2997323 RepID=A0A9X3IUA8_9GAMM|nr:PLP-dependent aminotransferase family protein [Parathalassolituus penaei]MCY0966774.1 PLP-dependent aminotransferase family protein [Parathalassolituus penaei]
MTSLYEQIADDISTNIMNGLYRPGERLPGVRQLAQARGVSIATVMAAYRNLENRTLVEARDRSGFYVCGHSQKRLPEPAVAAFTPAPAPVTGQELVAAMARAASAPATIQLGAAVPDSSFVPMRQLQASMATMARHHGLEAMTYQFPPGLAELRRQIARRMVNRGCVVSADDVVITNGCQEALIIALQATTSPGDLVALESPAYYGLLQVLESLQLKALEIPVHPSTGLSLEALELALSRWPIKACVVVPNFNNPLGFCMPDEHKQRLVDLLNQHEVALIEDDVYGDLGYHRERPKSCKGMLRAGMADRIYYCSSFSKTLAPGLRIGWLSAPTSQRARVEHLKYVQNMGVNSLAQRVVADFLENGGYDRHLRQLTSALALATSRMASAIQQYFPAGTRVSRPEGGYVLWLELPEGVDAIRLTQQALQRGISIAPGPLFSASGRFGNCIRLSCACRWNPALEQGLQTLASLIEVQMNEASH